jgi:hypothetical protein
MVVAVYLHLRPNERELSEASCSCAPKHEAHPASA